MPSRTVPTRQKSDQLGLQIETTFKHAPVDDDLRLLECLAANLIDNAIGHNLPGGSVQISVDDTEGAAVLTVINTGPVIRADEIDRLFQPFQRLDPRRVHHEKGHGLGLSIVRAVAVSHGATIAAHPIPNGGLSVTISFPPPSCANTSASHTNTDGRILNYAISNPQ